VRDDLTIDLFAGSCSWSEGARLPECDARVGGKELDACGAIGQAARHLKQVGGPTPKSGGRLIDGRTWDEYPSALGSGTGHG
jgi:protein gp37